jgi:hypothetical protein
LRESRHANGKERQRAQEGQFLIVFLAVEATPLKITNGPGPFLFLALFSTSPSDYFLSKAVKRQFSCG